MTLIDTHAHLDAAGGIPALAPPVEGQTPTQVIAVTNLPSRYARLQRILHDRVQWALGLHPAQPHPRTALDDFLALLPTCTAVGEIGLDATTIDGRHAVPLDRQQAELEAILKHPETARRLVSLHSRRSVPLVLEHLRTAAIPGAVLHWFTGTPGQARKAADTGAFFSVNARMRGKSELLSALPPERVLVETDAPHTGKTTAAGDVRSAIAMLAETWQTTVTAAEDQILTNQRVLIGRLDVPPVTRTA